MEQSGFHSEVLCGSGESATVDGAAGSLIFGFASNISEDNCSVVVIFPTMFTPGFGAILHSVLVTTLVLHGLDLLCRFAFGSHCKNVQRIQSYNTMWISHQLDNINSRYLTKKIDGHAEALSIGRASSTGM